MLLLDTNSHNQEKRYFEPGNLGFKTFRCTDMFKESQHEVASSDGDVICGMMICNDRRWPESFRVFGLQDVELLMCGYNTPQHSSRGSEHDHLQEFQSELCLQAGAYHNCTFVIGVAKGSMHYFLN